jgi:hypothetical protein
MIGRQRGLVPVAVRGGRAFHRVVSITFFLAWISLAAFLEAASAQSCASDCDGDGSVVVGELVLAIGVALGTTDRNRCPAADMDRNGAVSVEELVDGVARSISGCFFRAGREAVEDATRVEDTTRNTLPKFLPLNFGGIVAGAGASFRVERSLPAGATGFAGGLAGGGAGRPVPEQCIRGDTGSGTRFRSCDDSNTLTTTYSQCRFSGESVVRNGVEKRTVVVADDPSYNLCEHVDETPPDDATVTVVLEDYSALSASGGVRLANLRQTFEPALRPPCVVEDNVFLDGKLTVNGFLHTVCDPNQDLSCDATLADVGLTARDLVLQMAYAQPGVCGLTTRVDGSLFVDNASTGESFAQTFLGLTIMETVVGDRRIVSQDGRVIVDCLGEVEYTTREALSIGVDTFCAAAGELAIVIRNSSAGGASSQSTAQTLAQQAALETEPNSPSISGPLHDLAYRSSNGGVYQVLMNPEGDRELQSEDVQITTVVGSTDGISECSTISTSQTQAQAVVSAAPGLALPLDRVFVSPILDSATAPCFNPNGKNGDGLLCFGDCTSADCRCVRSGFCLEFSLGNPLSTGGDTGLVALADSGFRGRLVRSLASLNAPCSGAVGRSTFAFGTDNPTIDPGLCTSRPPDGFSLRPRQSVLFAYDVPPTSEFIAGAAGFPIDQGGDSPRCRATNAVVTGVATKNELGRARVTFRNGRVDFDVNDDKIVEQSLASCSLLSAADCAAPPPPPSPTPGRQCPEFMNGLQRQGSTAGGFNVLGGASCGDGGNRSAERSYLFRAPANGCFRFFTSGSGFDTLLYARRGSSCEGPEVACNDNADSSTLDSEIFVRFDRNDEDLGDQAVIVVDGNSGASGNFRLDSEAVPVGNCDRGGPTRGPAYVAGLPDGGTCTVDGSPCMERGATVSCSGLSPGSFQDLFFGLRNDQFVLGETMSGRDGPTASSSSVFRHAGGSGATITYAGASNPEATSIFEADEPVETQSVATRLLLTLTSGTGTIIAAGGVPADNANGDVGSLFRITSSSFSVRVELQASTPTFPSFASSCTGLFDPTHTRNAVDQEISRVDLGFYWRESPRRSLVGAALRERCDAGTDAGAGCRSTGAALAPGAPTPTPRPAPRAQPSSTGTPTETPTPSPTREG